MAIGTGQIDNARADATDRYTDEVGLESQGLAGNLGSQVNDAVSRGIGTLKDQYRVVSERGVQGVRDDVVGYAKREPLKALLLAGGIGALAALILRRR